MVEYIIVYVRGSYLKEITLAEDEPYNFCDYTRASRLSWPGHDRASARSYARELAQRHGLTFVPSHEDKDDEQEQLFLD